MKVRGAWLNSKLTVTHLLKELGTHIPMHVFITTQFPAGLLEAVKRVTDVNSSTGHCEAERNKTCKMRACQQRMKGVHLPRRCDVWRGFGLHCPSSSGDEGQSRAHAVWESAILITTALGSASTYLLGCLPASTLMVLECSMTLQQI